ncbi:MAG: SEC-C domain-containing protein [Pseudolabrys sp.]
MTILDSRVWNVHGGLLKAVTAVDGEIYREGHKLIFAHATSAYPGDLYGGTMPISAKDCGCEALLRFFANDHLRALQEQYLSAFLRNNFETLRNLGILNTISNARRNDPCPCGSGKKFKHLHDANA